MRKKDVLLLVSSVFMALCGSGMTFKLLFDHVNNRASKRSVKRKNDQNQPETKKKVSE